MKNTCLVFFLVFSSTCFAQSIKSPLWTTLTPGDFDVGFKVQYLIDTTRTMASTDSLPHALNGKPLRIKIYYPGLKDSSSIQLNFSDQINVFPKNPQLATYNAILNTRDRRLQGQFSPASDSLKHVLFRTLTMAYLDIPVAAGKFPLLIYELGLDDHQMENSVLWEYLASHGYVVAVLPCFGFNLENQYIPYTGEGALELYQDAVFTMNHMSQEAYVDQERIGAIGHSFGGIVAMLVASRHQEVKAIAALDASINNARALPILASLGLDSTALHIPVLNLYTKAHEKDLSFIQSLHTPVYQVGFNKASHFDFQNFPLYAYITNKPDRRVVKRRSTEEGKDILLSTIKLTKHFFDFVLDGQKNSEAFIRGQTVETKIIRELGVFENE